MRLYAIDSNIEQYNNVYIVKGFIPDRNCKFPRLSRRDKVIWFDVDVSAITGIDYPFVYIEEEDLRYYPVTSNDERIDDLVVIRGAALAIARLTGGSDKLRTAACRTSEDAYQYARNVDEAPCDETREAASRKARLAYRYAVDVDKAPHEVTKRAVQSLPEYCVYYVVNLIHDRDPEIEQILIPHPRYMFDYIERVCNGVCPADLEDKIVVTEDNVLSAARYIKSNDRLRKLAAKNKHNAVYYAYTVDNGPNDITREGALVDPYTAYSYALYIDRYPRDDTRAAACKDVTYAWYYAFDVDKGFHPLTYVKVLEDEETACMYIRTFIKDRTEIMDEIIASSSDTTLLRMRAKEEVKLKYPDYFSETDQ